MSVRYVERRESRIQSAGARPRPPRERAPSGPCVLTLALTAAVVLALPARARAQDLVTARSVILRGTASKAGAQVRTLAPGETLSLRAVPVRPGYLPVRTMDGKEGWVGAVHVRDLHAAAAAAATRVLGTVAAGRIDTTWEKPPLRSDTILVQGGKKKCGPPGSKESDDGTNVRKNRADIPETSHLVTLDAIRSLPDTTLWHTNSRKFWTQADRALVDPYEGVALTVEGYFAIVRPQKTSESSAASTESVNCQSWAEEDTDWHIALVADPNETEDRAVIVEPTPRTKRQNRGWDPRAASLLAVRHTKARTDTRRYVQEAARVRVTGFLMLDPLHAAHIEGKCKEGCAKKKLDGKFFRATLWELHPVTRIEVWRDGKWVDLNDLAPPR